MLKVSKEFYENKSNRKLADEVTAEIHDCLMRIGFGDRNSIDSIKVILNELSRVSKQREISYEELIKGETDIDFWIVRLTQKYHVEKIYDNLLSLVNHYSSEIIALSLLLDYPELDSKWKLRTPDFICCLVQKILDVKARESVGNYYSGMGDFLVSLALEEKDTSYYGYNANVEESAIASYRLKLVSENIRITTEDVFCLDMSEEEKKFNKVFSNYPFMLNMKIKESGAGYVQKFLDEHLEMSKATSSDWYHNLLLYEAIKKDGRAVGIMTNGCTWNATDKQMRRYFIENGMIEAIISLPDRLFRYTNIATTLIVLSHNNKFIRMIDATNLCQQGRRQNELSQENIQQITDAINQDFEYSRVVSLDEFRENEYSLNPKVYLETCPEITGGVPFETVIKQIKRGAPFTAKQLDEMVSDAETNMQYLMLANIQNGIIDSKLPYLAHIDKKNEKYCLNDNSLVISKNGFPYKIAVASVKEGQQILANGSLYAIELDEEKVNPFYLKAFFESSKGTALLKSISSGAVILGIGIDSLKKVKIPLPSMEVQNRVAKAYQATLDEIQILRLRIEKATDRLQNIYDQESREN